MNKVILMGRLTRDPEVRYSAGENALAIARYTLAVDRRFRRDGEATADFISCVSFGRTAEFAEKYFRQGLKIIVSGRIQTGSYTNRDGQKVYTTEVVVEEQEFAESKNASEYSRHYVDEESERTDVVGYAPSNDYEFDRYTNDLVQQKIAEITDDELLGSDAQVSIVVVDLFDIKADTPNTPGNTPITPPPTPVLAGIPEVYIQSPECS